MEKKKVEPETEPKLKMYRLTITEEIEAGSIDEARKLAKDRIGLIDKTRIEESIQRVVRAKYSSRASRLGEAEGMISNAKGVAEELRDECQEWYDNLPENFQDGDKGSQLQECIDTLDSLIQSLEEAEGNCGAEFPGMY